MSTNEHQNPQRVPTNFHLLTQYTTKESTTAQQVCVQIVTFDRALYLVVMNEIFVWYGVICFHTKSFLTKFYFYRRCHQLINLSLIFIHSPTVLQDFGSSCPMHHCPHYQKYNFHQYSGEKTAKQQIKRSLPLHPGLFF